MKKEHIALAKHRLEKALESVEDAKLLLKSNRLRGAMNRTYYSVLYGAKALLATKAVDSSKHSGVAVLFYREFIEPDIVSRNAGRILNQLLRKRLKGDYTDFYSF